MIGRDKLMLLMMVADAGGNSGNPLRILVIEDEALVALEIESFLTAAGHIVVGVAADGGSAARLARQATPQPDLALVDIRLANGSSGVQIAADFATLGIPVLFVTGNCPGTEDRSVALGCLSKPFTEGELVASVAAAEAVMRGRPLPRRLPSGLQLYGTG
ncbi:response regulator [Siccirubricoccus sp. KC 17139]|uniref:Response regulator n=1 Tax=Siccirubricoccus soli TaxID=2899147 RepID=A0ABT1D5D5_9PROT|nr:response regulator [Siccirubricoccus soli]MCO6417133.1 response regulator [Siccirubricoccus soli]MCP2683268.1 response regulator [Siccirubricoccus soli]